MNAEAMYGTICRSVDPAAAVGRLGDSALAVLITDLNASGMHSGIQALVCGSAASCCFSRSCRASSASRMALVSTAISGARGNSQWLRADWRDFSPRHPWAEEGNA